MNLPEMNWLDWRWLVTAFVVAIVWVMVGLVASHVRHPPKNGHYPDLEAPFRER